MADAYLQWKYSCGVDLKPTSTQSQSPSSIAGSAAEASTPLPAKSTSSDLDHTPVNNALPDTTPTVYAPANSGPINSAPSNDTRTLTPSTNNITVNPPMNNTPTTSADTNSDPSQLPGSTEHGARGDGLPLPGVDIEIAVIDIYTLSTSVKVSSAHEETTASALAGLGFIGNAPFKPSVAVSMKTLELYQTLQRRKPSFSIEAFVKVISDLYLVRLPPRYHPVPHLLTSRYPTVPSTAVSSQTRLMHTWKSLKLLTIV
jgi:hypothetical protein